MQHTVKLLATLQQTLLKLMVWKLAFVHAYDCGNMQLLSQDIILQEPGGYETGAPRAKGPKRQRVTKTAADSKPSTGSGSLDSHAQLSSEAEFLTQPDTGPITAQLEDPTQQEHDLQLTQPQSDSNAVKDDAVEVQQHSSVSQQHLQSEANAAGIAKREQQSTAGVAQGPGLLPAHRKEPLCLRVRPLDSPTRRLMQSLGFTALLEMPNNK